MITRMIEIEEVLEGKGSFRRKRLTETGEWEGEG